MKKIIATVLINIISCYCFGQDKKIEYTIEGQIKSNIDSIQIYQAQLHYFDENRYSYAISGEFRVNFLQSENDTLKIIRFSNFGHDFKDTIINLKNSRRLKIVLNRRVGKFRFQHVSEMKKIMKKYFKSMYVKKDFDAATTFWDSNMLDRLKKRFKSRFTQIPNNETILNEIKKEVQSRFYRKNRKIKIVEFPDSDLNDSHILNENGRKSIIMSYKCRAQSGKSSQREYPFMFLFESFDNGKTWSLIDVNLSADLDPFN